MLKLYIYYGEVCCQTKNITVYFQHMIESSASATIYRSDSDLYFVAFWTHYIISCKIIHKVQVIQLSSI